MLCNNNEPFLDQIKWILCDNQQQPAQWLDWEEAPKPNRHQNKGHSHCLVVCGQSDPLQLSETTASERYAQQINEMHWKTCNTCIQHWSTERAQFFSMTTADCTSHTNASKVEQSGLQSFASSTIFTRCPANQWPLLQASRYLFMGKTLPQPAGCRKCFPRVCWIPSMDFYATGINQVISHLQKCVDCNSSYFD